MSEFAIITEAGNGLPAQGEQVADDLGTIYTVGASVGMVTTGQPGTGNAVTVEVTPIGDVADDPELCCTDLGWHGEDCMCAISDAGVVLL